MDKKEAVKIRSLGEAHLYIAIAKVDGIVTMKERARTPHYAQKSQDVFNVLKINKHVRSNIKKDVNKILSDPKYIKWTAQHHLDCAIAHLKKAKKLGDWGVSLSGHKNEKGLENVALLDGYILKESRFLKKIKEMLKELN